jgi:hypothetical protein
MDSPGCRVAPWRRLQCDKGAGRQGWDDKSPLAAVQQIIICCTAVKVPWRTFRVVTQENEMKIVLSLAAAAVIVATGAVAAELPTYEVTGFPISPAQTAVVGAAHVQESAAPTADGKALSPHQISVLSAHKKRTAAATAPALTTGAATR